MLRHSLIFVMLLLISSVSLADWKVELASDLLYGEKHHTVQEKTSNQSKGSFGLICYTRSSEDTSYSSAKDIDLFKRDFLAVFGIQISVPESMKPRENERFELDVRVDDNPLRNLANLYSFSQDGIYREDIFGIYPDEDIGSPGPVYRTPNLRELLNELFDGNILRYRLSSKSIDIRGEVDLSGLTMAAMPVLNTCSVESREQVANLKTYAEASREEKFRQWRLQSQSKSQ